MPRFKIGDRVKFKYKGWGDKRPIVKTGRIISYHKHYSQPYEVHTGGEKYYFLSASKPAKKSMSWGYIMYKIGGKK